MDASLLVERDERREGLVEVTAQGAAAAAAVGQRMAGSEFQSRSI